MAVQAALTPLLVPGQGQALPFFTHGLGWVCREGAGRVWLFTHSEDFDADRARIEAHGGRRAEAPRAEPPGRVVVFTDPGGNRWDLIEPAADRS